MDGSPPANDRLKSFALDKNELAKLLLLKLVDLEFMNFGIFAKPQARKAHGHDQQPRALPQSGRVPPGIAEFGHRLTVGFGWSPHDGLGLTYHSFHLQIHHFYKLGRSL
eukprot:6058618-Pleurochrysis_carterae.AAC.1